MKYKIENLIINSDSIDDLKKNKDFELFCNDRVIFDLKFENGRKYKLSCKFNYIEESEND